MGFNVKSFTAVAFLFLFTTCASAYNSQDNVGTYNLILKGDLISQPSDIEGALFINGSIEENNSFTTGIDIDRRDLVVFDKDADAVVVLGNGASGDSIQSSAINVNSGSVVYGGTSSTTFNMNSGGTVTNVSGQALADLQAEFDALWDGIKQDSIDYSNLNSSNSEFIGTVNGGEYIIPDGASTPGTGGGQPLKDLILRESSSTDGGLVVFNINGDILDSFTNLFIDISAAASVIVNVSGINITTSFNFNSWGSAASNVLWNFYEATEINFGGNEWNGSILAPYATITTGGSGAVNGAIAANSLDSKIELHSFLFNSPPEPPTSEPVNAPASLTVLLSAILIIAIRRKIAKRF